MNELAVSYKTIEMIKRGIYIHSHVTLTTPSNSDHLLVVVSARNYKYEKQMESHVLISHSQMIGMCNHDIIIECFIRKTNRLFRELMK